MNQISISTNKNIQTSFSTEELETFIYSVLNFLKKDKCELSVAIETSDVLHDLNKNYRDIDSSTDILSFTANELNPESGYEYLGDLTISYDHVISQAESSKHSSLDELKFLIIHGILHLLGYDHETQETKDQMWDLKKEIIRSLQLSINIPN